MRVLGVASFWDVEVQRCELVFLRSLHVGCAVFCRGVRLRLDCAGNLAFRFVFSLCWMCSFWDVGLDKTIVQLCKLHGLQCSVPVPGQA